MQSPIGAGLEGTLILEWEFEGETYRAFAFMRQWIPVVVAVKVRK
jgi:hypothetical protein